MSNLHPIYLKWLRWNKNLVQWTREKNVNIYQTLFNAIFYFKPKKSSLKEIAALAKGSGIDWIFGLFCGSLSSWKRVNFIISNVGVEKKLSETLIIANCLGFHLLFNTFHIWVGVWFEDNCYYFCTVKHFVDWDETLCCRCIQFLMIHMYHVWNGFFSLLLYNLSIITFQQSSATWTITIS